MGEKKLSNEEKKSELEFLINNLSELYPQLKDKDHVQDITNLVSCYEDELLEVEEKLKKEIEEDSWPDDTKEREREYRKEQGF